MFFDFSNTDVQKEIISGFFSILNTLIAAIAAGGIGRLIARQGKLKDQLRMAVQDISFLLKVEEIHCENNKIEFKESRKNKVRKEARIEGYNFSGEFTPGRIRSQDIFR
ncbi:hypothetical protein [Synechococcus sp. BDU 130192]|uniref:hypothetical protein n=1 Tax=Synechococcus sp. BDU 130192 TaxID=2042059 RepID=UPI001C1F21D3|nr:hypothetical protein [Synechococcus sp. BDU 130192]